MKVSLGNGTCTVEREPSDKRPRASGWAPGPAGAESAFLYQLKRALIAQGHDVIKRRLHADGHMMGDAHSQYIRERKHAFYIFDGAYQVRDLAEAFWTTGKVVLLVQRNEGK